MGAIRMSGLTNDPVLRRNIRQGPFPELGESTLAAIDRALDAGKIDEAKELVRYTLAENKPLHDLYCDWIWSIFTEIANRHGEKELGHLIQDTMSTWMLRRTWKAMLKWPVALRAQFIIEMFRAHQSGPQQDGGITVTEDETSITVTLDPCGSGGRMRRGDPVDGTGSRLDPPYSFGVTKEAHDWSFSQKGVPYYCAHCAVNERKPMEWGGYPMWVTLYDPDHSKPCRARFYKRPEDIPDFVFERAGMKRPPPGEGKY